MTTLIQACRSHATFRESDLAAIDGDTAYSWGALVDRVARVAAGLAELGLTPGDRIGILALNSADYLVTQLAAWWIGAVVVPMNIRWSTAENIYCARDAGLAILVVDPTFAAEALAIKETAPDTKLMMLGVAAADRFTTLEQLIDTNQPSEAGPPDASALAGIYYTGGTTGSPKGVMLTHGALVAASMGMLPVLQIGDTSRVLHAAPMFHLADGAMGHAAIVAGACNVYVPKFETESAIGAIERHGVTDALLVPTMVGMLLAAPSFVPERLSSLKSLCYGASPMSASVLTKLQLELRNVRLIHCYGQTEMGPLVSYLDPRHQVPDSARSLSIGKPFAMVDVRIVDEAGETAEVGQPGEILARGPAMMLGYWNKPDETTKAMVDGWVRTGDIAYRDADGFMFICDRAKDMIITGGENVFSAEVENAIASHPAVAQVAVIGIPDPEYGERVHAVIVTRAEHSIDQAALFGHCRELIANYKCPRSMELRDAMPISGAGKILKRDLRDPYWEGRSRAVN